VIALVLPGAAAGLGLWLVWCSLTSRPTLAEIEAALSAPGRAVRASGAASLGQAWASPAVGRAVRALAALGLDPARRAADLRVTQRTAEQHVARQLVWAAGLTLTAVMLGVVLGVGAALVLLTAVVAAGAGLLLPERALTGEAAEARTAFRHAFGAYLDLVTVMESAGVGPETALYRAAEAGEGWAFGELRAALAAARRTRRSSWDALAGLGADLGVTELAELAASLVLVEHEGARIRRTLEAKADAMRAEQLADAKARAGATTEKMTLPVVLLLVAFLVFIAFPAAVRIGEVGGT
jgi:Flp pilus assembly protein TadB